MSKWGVVYITPPSGSGLPKDGPNAGQFTGWVRSGDNLRFYETRKEADSLARRMRAWAQRQGHECRYMVAEYPDE